MSEPYERDFNLRVSAIRSFESQRTHTGEGRTSEAHNRAYTSALLAPGLAPLFGGMVSVLILLAGFKATVEKWARRKILTKQSGIASIRELSWSSFELLVGQAYRQQGYEVIETGGGGPDGGIDLKLLRNGTTTIVQCKQWKAWKISVKAIRELYGVLMSERADHAIFVTSGEFTKEAREFARGKPLELLDGDALSRLVRSVRLPAGTTSVTSATELECKIEEAPQTPICPRCRGLMVVRTARRGANAGSQFWGCTSFPKCRGTMPKMVYQRISGSTFG